MKDYLCGCDRASVRVRLALLTNFIPPYRVPLYRALRAEAGELRIFVTTRMEKNRSWAVDWADLDVVPLRTFTMRRRWGTDQFTDRYELHVPVNVGKQLRAYRPEAIIAGELGLRSLQALRYAKRARIPALLWATLADHLEQNWSGLRTRFRRWLSSQADAVIVNGESGARYFRRFGIPDDRLLRVPYVTDMEPLLRLPASRNSGQIRELLYVGALSERKGVQQLLDALEALQRDAKLPVVRLTLVGDGPLRDALVAQARNNNIELAVTGHVPYEQLPQWYAGADVLLFPTLGDEWGLVVNEALAAAVPVFGSTYSQAVDELIQDGSNGWRFTPTDAPATRMALANMLATASDDLLRMRAHARASVAHLTPAWAAARMIAFLRAQ